MLKHKQKILVLLVSFTALCIGVNTTIEALSLNDNKISIKAEEDIDTWMPDKNLQEAVRVILKLNDVSEITKESLSSLQQIKINAKKIQNIKGLEYAINIKSFNASYNQISDLSPIANLTSLKTVYLNMNEISDLTPLSGLKGIEALRLAHNQISDLSPISGLTKLRIVFSGGNRISDISPLAGLTSLTTIDLSFNQVSDLTPLSGVTSLMAFTVTDQDITKETKTIQESKYRQQLNVKTVDGRFVDLMPASSDGVYKGDGIIEWSGLSLGDHALNSSWETMIKINDQDTRFNGSIKQKVTVAEDINAWMPDKNLQEEIRVALKLNDVSEITKQKLSSLPELIADAKKIQNLKGLEYATNLRFLNASRNQISDLKSIAGLSSLRTLYISNNQINDLGPISGLTLLVNLNLNDNQIGDLRPLSGLTSLKLLYLNTNQISDVSPLSNLTSLIFLDIAGQYLFKETKTIKESEYRQQLNVKTVDGSFVDLIPASGNGVYKGDGIIEWTGLSSGDNDLNSSWESIIKVDNRDAKFSGNIRQKIIVEENIDTWMPDKNLQEEIKVALKLNDVSKITKQSLSTLKQININTKEIQNLKGLEYATNIKSFNASHNQISDLSPIANLTSLTNLDLSANQITDLSPISGLTSLKILFLSNNQVSDLSPLSDLTSLVVISLGINQIIDLSPLSDLKSLTNIGLNSNKISDVSPLSSLTSLTTVTLNSNKISDASPLSGLTSLTGVYLDDNQISDLGPISSLKLLTTLTLNRNKIDDLSPISSLKRLEALTLSGNQISDLSPLSGLTLLKRLMINNQDITKDTKTISKSEYRQQLDVKIIDGRFVDLTPASSNGTYKGDGVIEWTGLSSGDNNLNSSWDIMIKINNQDTRFNGTIKQKVTVTTEAIDAWMPDKNLQEGIRVALKLDDVSQITKESLSSLSIITINSQKIQNLNGLEYATNLGNLSAIDNQISDLRPISGLTSLTNLSLSANQISDLSLISNLTSLINLDLRTNQIGDLSPLSNFTSLKNVALDTNQISDLSPLSGLTSLKYVYLDDNKISDLSPLSGLKRVETLSLESNKISDLSPLSGLTSLRIIYAKGNQISDLSSLSVLPSLIWLTINDQDITKDTKTISESEYQQHLDVKTIDGRFVDLIPASNNGIYKGDGVIEWTELSSGEHNLNSSWDIMIKINNLDTRFHGTIKQKVLVAADHFKNKG